MLIPIKCFTCGEILANKYLYYEKEVRKIKSEKNIDSSVLYLTEESLYEDETAEKQVLDRLGLVKFCCRRHMLTHVDIF